MKILIILWTIFSYGSFSYQKEDIIKTIDIETFKSAVIGKDVQLIDIRTPREYKAGFIDDAININSYDAQQFSIAFQKLDKEKPIYIYCYSGGRSNRASKKLAAMGFKKIFDFKGGYKAWSNQ
ncbi:rhodanese-like domain-containing protein [Aquimarina algiphila]|uniref:rhodanese-like domain-containing protein n=1 Tax=Aquimarina algiphila TaxID=2047982 RepID=UPI0024933243|nr:rhodanese-like domain-containing protein [Aquimarina algiphila]